MSAVTIAGRRFPTVGLVCPPDPHNPDYTDTDRSLGTGNDTQVYIPAENGVLFAVQPDLAPAASPGAWCLHLCSAVCEQAPDMADGTWLWLPASVAWVDGALGTGGYSQWWNADPDWVVETIDRLSRLPFTEPDGPRVRFVEAADIDSRTVQA